MKRIISLIIAVVVMTMSTAVFADNSPSVYLNGEKMSFTDNVNPYIDSESGRTLIPMRDIYQAIGAVVQWDEDTRTAIAVKGDTYVTVQIGSTKAFVNSEEHTLDVAGVITNDRTFLPLRFVVEAMGAQVEWDNENYAVMINVD